MIDLWLEMHAQTHDNVRGVASGHFDVALTEQGRSQASSVLRERYAQQRFDAAYTSDTQRAYDTACLMFADRALPIFQDARLRECDYGIYEGRPRAEMEAARAAALDRPYPGGESYRQVAARMRSLLAHLGRNHDRQCLMLIGHAATLFTLRHLLQELPLEETLGVWPERPWRFSLSPAAWKEQGE